MQSVYSLFMRFAHTSTYLRLTADVLFALLPDIITIMACALTHWIQDAELSLSDNQRDTVLICQLCMYV